MFHVKHFIYCEKAQKVRSIGARGRMFRRTEHDERNERNEYDERNEQSKHDERNERTNAMNATKARKGIFDGSTAYSYR